MMNVECRSTLSPLQVTKNLASINDIIVLAKDIMTIPEDEIISTEVLYTILVDTSHNTLHRAATSRLRETS